MGAFQPEGPVRYSDYSILKWSPQLLVPTAAVNVLMVAMALWLMRQGLREDRTHLFAAGVLYFLLWTILRYFDLFGGVGGMLGASLMFLLCGVGLFAVARFWQHRREYVPLADNENEAGDAGCGEIGIAEEALTLNLPQGGKRLKQLGLSADVVFQLVVLVGMILFKAGPLWSGETVLLRVVPVDPRDMFRGDYVTLSYDFSRVPPEGIEGLGDAEKKTSEGRTVYVSLVPEEDGEHWRMSKMSIECPATGRFIRGTVTQWNRVECGIESYYVQEGQGREYEEAARDQKLSAEVALAADGRATLRDLRIEGRPRSTGPAYDAQRQFRWPSNKTYRLARLTQANVKIDGRLDESEWARANVERQFGYPWQEGTAPLTEFMAFCDRDNLYYAFRVEDSDIFVLDEIRDEKDIGFEDRVEVFLSCDSQMRKYVYFEIDSRGRVYDLQASYYRQSDATWNCEGIEAAAQPTDDGYIVEVRIPLKTLRDAGLPEFGPGARVLCGLYRAEFSHDRSGKPVERKPSIHHHGRTFEGTPPLEAWISWVDPNTPEPDFHVPSSLGCLEVVE